MASVGVMAQASIMPECYQAATVQVLRSCVHSHGSNILNIDDYPRNGMNQSIGMRHLIDHYDLMMVHFEQDPRGWIFRQVDVEECPEDFINGGQQAGTSHAHAGMLRT